ncbi:MAG: MBL fold metallo-hydrolase [Gammaproteobacteria bacterium]|jgi:glyoxylase-like metal-dependent hydrolase (beta-lactamase superfamily II)|nr:MBL fold metallo-hydrolase [Gammaproteobacteria bacterium]
MMNARIVLACFVLSLAGCSDQPVPSNGPENGTSMDVLEKTLAAIGGREALVNLKTFSTDGTREAYLMGQGPEPGRGLFKRGLDTVQVAYDIAGPDIRLDTSTQYPARGGGYDARVSTELIIGQAGFMSRDDLMGIVSERDNALLPEQVAARTKTERLLNPHILLQELAIDSSRASAAGGAADNSAARRFSVQEALPVTLDRVRQTGRRTLLATQEWLTDNEDTRFFEMMAEKVTVGDDWLARWHEATTLTEPHEQLVIDNDIFPITLHVNSETGHIDKLTTTEWDVVYGDISLEVSYHDWQVFDGLYFPMHIRMSVGGAPRIEVQRSRVTVNPTVAATTFAPPEGVAYSHDEERAQRGRRVSQSLFAFGFAGVGPPEIASVAIEPGVTLVYAVPLDSVYSLIVEQAAGLVLIEPGENDLKGEAILEWANENYPGKPITHVIVSHHHNDHAGGIRPYVAAGATIVAHEAAKEFFTAQCARPASKIVVDALDRNPVPATIVGVPADEPYRIDDGLRPVTVYPMEMGHTSDMVFAVVEPEKILYAGDLYISGLARDLRAGRKRPADILPFHSAVSLLEAIQAYGLDVPTLVGSHDRQPASYADLGVYVNGEE